jgi:membrane protein
MLRVRLLSLGIVLAIGFLLLVTLVVSSALSALGHLWDPLLGRWNFVLQAVNFVVSLGVITVLFALIYKLLPRARIDWGDVWIGAAVTALLFTLGKLLIGLYIGKTGVASGFGAAGSLVVILVWVYFSAQIFLLGAEFTWQYSYRYGSRRGQAPPQSALAQRGRGAAGDEAQAAHDESSAHAWGKGKWIVGAALASGVAAGTALRRGGLLRALRRARRR